MLLIGSRALEIWNAELLGRKPKDFDFISTEEEAFAFLDKVRPSGVREWASPNKLIVRGDIPLEFEIIRDGSSAQLLVDAVNKDPLTIDLGLYGLVPSMNKLFMLKASHKYLKDSPHFWKNALDYHRMKAAGASIESDMLECLKLREAETYKHKHPRLNVSKKEFFNNDQVRYVYDHDSIHEAVKHLARPAYTYFAADGEQVKSDKKKFFECSREIQLLATLEESYVLSIERSQVPHPGGMTPRASFMLALSKVCTSITSGWFREFSYENVFHVLSMYSEEYMDKFRTGLEAGVVRPFKGRTPHIG